MPKLSDTQIKAAIRTTTKSGQGRKLYDELGLYLQLTPKKGKCGSCYDWMGKERLLSLGVYPDVGLSLARDRGDGIRKQIFKIDTLVQRRRNSPPTSPPSRHLGTKA
jgi:hypothetical protein